MSSVFNAEQFLNTQYSAATDTKFISVPIGEYPAQIEKVDFTSFESKKGETYYQGVVIWGVLDDKVKEATGFEKPTVRQRFFIDVVIQNGQAVALDMGRGKNIQLGKLREVLRQNDASRPWAPSMMVGGMGRIKVIHTPNEKDPASPYAEVEAVTSL